MSKVEPMDQVRFLVSCIGHTSNGRSKPDFEAVALDLGIVSKAAAQKRYERMLKANNVTPVGRAASKAPAAANDDEAKPGARKPAAKKTAGAKRTPVPSNAPAPKAAAGSKRKPSARLAVPNGRRAVKKIKYSDSVKSEDDSDDKPDSAESDDEMSEEDATEKSAARLPTPPTRAKATRAPASKRGTARGSNRAVKKEADQIKVKNDEPESDDVQEGVDEAVSKKDIKRENENDSELSDPPTADEGPVKEEQ
ncbi:hypothetical protein B0I35DRAFT_408161 [Stachybotrys elegans]|uniref:Myb-like DNA-binding domain-containing protein n=1 Tax=Stachybotrys elegans TaxID=80388 RepID=A0A8K0WU19_9HYPO|nr:hypothetical protein B0I35DRAFT_408161 [Stachybotrys elegans]